MRRPSLLVALVTCLFLSLAVREAGATDVHGPLVGDVTRTTPCCTTTATTASRWAPPPARRTSAA